MTENRQPCFYNDDGEPVVYRREDPPPGDGPRFLFPELEPCPPGDKKSSYDFVVSMAKCLGGTTKPADADAVASKCATAYLEGRVPRGLNELELITATTRQEWLMTMIAHAGINTACHMALEKILTHPNDTQCPIPPELQDWDPNAERPKRSNVMVHDRRSVAERLLAMCGVLHAVVQSGLPQPTCDREASQWIGFTLCDAVGTAMKSLGYPGPGLGYDTLRRIMEDNWPGGLTGLQDHVRTNVFQPDRSDTSNSAEILRFFGIRKKLN